MNPQFRFGRLTRRTMLSLSRAIGPMEIGVEGLDEHVVNHIETQLRSFPWLHRWGLLIGITFIEWGGPLGAWGLVPFSLLSRKQATNRLYLLMKSRFTPARLLVNGLRVLISLSAYSHGGVEQWFGFDRRRWRHQRVKTRASLLARDQLTSDQYGTLGVQTHLPPTPDALYTHRDENQITLLSWHAHEEINHASLPTSPFMISNEAVISIENQEVVNTHQVEANHDEKAQAINE